MKNTTTSINRLTRHLLLAAVIVALSGITGACGTIHGYAGLEHDYDIDLGGDGHSHSKHHGKHHGKHKHKHHHDDDDD